MKRGYPARFVCVAIALMSRTATFGQPIGPGFEVASIKPSEPEARIGAITFPPGRFSVDNVPLRTVLLRIYGLNDYQLSGGPDWLKDRYNIQAKAPVGEFNDSQIRAMAQRLIEQRFQLKLHHESKPLPVYVLTLGKNAAKLSRQPRRPALPQSASPRERSREGGRDYRPSRPLCRAYWGAQSSTKPDSLPTSTLYFTTIPPPSSGCPSGKDRPTTRRRQQTRASRPFSPRFRNSSA